MLYVAVAILHQIPPLLLRCRVRVVVEGVVDVYGHYGNVKVQVVGIREKYLHKGPRLLRSAIVELELGSYNFGSRQRTFKYTLLQ